MAATTNSPREALDAHPAHARDHEVAGLVDDDQEPEAQDRAEDGEHIHVARL